MLGDPYLDDVVRNGALYAVGQTLVATAVNGGQFVLFLPAAQNRNLYLLELQLQASAAIAADIFMLTVDPALALGNTPAGLNPPQGAALTKWEAAVAAQPAVGGRIFSAQLGPTLVVTPLRRALVRCTPGNGILVSSAAVSASVLVSAVFAELNADWEKSQ